MTLRHLVATALTLGTVHVLTGPDHLAALATLSANVGNFKAFFLGIRWGIGHSLGLILIGGIFIAIDQHVRSSQSQTKGDNTMSMNNTDTSLNNGDWNHLSESDVVLIPERLSLALETLVGVFMILLGLYGLYKAYLKSKASPTLHSNRTATTISAPESSFEDHCHHTHNKNLTTLCHPEERFDPESSPTHHFNGGPHEHNDSTSHFCFPTKKQKFENHVDHGNNEEVDALVVTSSPPSTCTLSSLHHPMDQDTLVCIHHHTHTHDTVMKDAHSHVHSHIQSVASSSSSSLETKMNYRKPLLALCIGMIHGVAGPGGILGVIPAVQLHHAPHAVLYLGVFCVTSTVTMGCFAALYGIISDWISKKWNCDSCCSCVTKRTKKKIKAEIVIEFFSSSLSLLVGIVWISLTSTHNMEKVFPE